MCKEITLLNNSPINYWALQKQVCPHNWGCFIPDWNVQTAASYQEDKGSKQTFIIKA